MKFTPVKKIRLPLSVYHHLRTVFVTILTAKRQKWFLRFPGLANEAVDILIENARDRGSCLYAWCIMPDHVHLLVEDSESVMDVAAYIFENPVRRGLVSLPHEYPFVGSEVWPNWRASYT